MSLLDDDDYSQITVKSEIFDDDANIKQEPKRRGRKPAVKQEVKMAPQPSVMPTPLVKPRKPRAKETKKRKPYNTKRSRSMDPTLQEMWREG
jgi:hypothetical protein